MCLVIPGRRLEIIQQDDAVPMGKVEFGGMTESAETGFFSRPTIITETRPNMSCVREEIFGPVLSVAGFDTEEEVIELANDCVYGLGASVWTDNLSRAHRVSGAIESGMVWVNFHTTVNKRDSKEETNRSQYRWQ